MRIALSYNFINLDVDEERVMDISLVLGLLGGLALFLYGMQMMSDGLEKAAGDRLKTILEKLTSNRILGVIVGAVITASFNPVVLQPSWLLDL